MVRLAAGVVAVVTLIQDRALSEEYEGCSVAPGCPFRVKCISGSLHNGILESGMHRLASFVAILLLLVTVSPALACVTDRAMSHEESVCCRTMHHQCGQMVKQGCCRMELRSGERPQLLASAPHTDVHWAVVARLASTAVSHRMIVLSLLQSPVEHAPPGLLTAKATVLRI